MSIFRKPHGYLHFQHPLERGQSHRSTRLTTSVVGRLRRTSTAVSDQLESEREQPSMNVVTVKFGEVQHKISFSLRAWFSCVEQKDRQEGLFFNLGCTGQEASCCRRKKKKTKLLPLFMTNNFFKIRGIYKMEIDG